MPLQLLGLWTRSLLLVLQSRVPVLLLLLCRRFGRQVHAKEAHRCLLLLRLDWRLRCWACIG